MAEVLVPLVLVFGFLSIIILVGIVFSYLWLSWLNAEAVKCPTCGRRGAGELVESEVVDAKAYTIWKDAPSLLGRSVSGRQRVRVSEKAYEDHFKCKYCGHAWTRTAREKTHSPT